MVQLQALFYVHLSSMPESLYMQFMWVLKMIVIIIEYSIPLFAIFFSLYFYYATKENLYFLFLDQKVVDQHSISWGYFNNK